MSARPGSRKPRRTAAAQPEFRSGIGYDIHRFARSRKRPLVLGGVHIPDARGLEGHSDADVLSHAIADALLGAVGERDIGHHFPNTDASIRGISSLAILARVREIVEARGGRIVNIDASLVAEAPRIGPFLEPMRAAIGEALGISLDRIGIKATTNERLGALGRREGIAAVAVGCVAIGG